MISDEEIEKCKAEFAEVVDRKANVFADHIDNSELDDGLWYTRENVVEAFIAGFKYSEELTETARLMRAVILQEEDEADD